MKASTFIPNFNDFFSVLRDEGSSFETPNSDSQEVKQLFFLRAYVLQFSLLITFDNVFN